MREALSRSVAILVIAFVGIAAIASAQQPGFAETPNSKKADEALATAHDAAKGRYLNARQEAFVAWLRGYEKALEGAIAAGDVEGAERLKQTIALSKAAGFPVRPIPQEALQFEGHSYLLVRDAVPFYAAKRRCEFMGGRLVTLQTKEEADFLVKSFGKETFFVGAGDFVKEGDARWLDDAPFDGHGYRTALDNYGGLENVIEWDVAGPCWNDVPEGISRFYVCEWDR